MSNLMSFNDWDEGLADQGVELSEVAESIGVSLEEVEKWRVADSVPENAIAFLRGLQGDLDDL